jgi:ABC-type uncharacterized transport system permease subunit
MCLLCALQAVANEDAIGALGLAVLGVSTALLAAAPRKGVPASASAAALVPVLLGVLGLLVWVSLEVTGALHHLAAMYRLARS